MKARFWFHCSSLDHGQRFVAFRKTPRHPAASEPPVPRLCVCSTVAACFASVLFPCGRPVHVYRTTRPRRSVAPRGVWDQAITGERWLIPPVELVKVETLPVDLVREAVLEISLYHDVTRKPSSRSLRIAEYARVIEVLGPRYTTRAEANLIRTWCQRHGIVDPGRWILDKADKESAA